MKRDQKLRGKLDEIEKKNRAMRAALKTSKSFKTLLPVLQVLNETTALWSTVTSSKLFDLHTIARAGFPMPQASSMMLLVEGLLQLGLTSDELYAIAVKIPHRHADALKDILRTGLEFSERLHKDLMETTS